MKQGDVRKGFRRGIYVIPTSFTVLNLFFGFRSIVNSIRALEMMANNRTDIAINFFEHDPDVAAHASSSSRRCADIVTPVGYWCAGVT